MIAALFVEKDGCYYGLPDVDPWDIGRDARAYAGPHPVVAHPPCDRWHQLSAVNAKRWGFKIDEDGGCFASALSAVRRFGGVLEHPAESRAFKHHGIPEPISGGWQRTIDGDWVTEVDQAAYGHRARKRTWLLYRGSSLPPTLDWRSTAGEFQIGWFDKQRPIMRKREAMATPTAFRDLLISIAMSARTTTTEENVMKIEPFAYWIDDGYDPGCVRTKEEADECAGDGFVIIPLYAPDVVAALIKERNLFAVEGDDAACIIHEYCDIIKPKDFERIKNALAPHLAAEVIPDIEVPSALQSPKTYAD